MAASLAVSLVSLEDRDIEIFPTLPKGLNTFESSLPTVFSVTVSEGEENDVPLSPELVAICGSLFLLR